MRILTAFLFFSIVCFGQGTEAKNCSLDGSVVNSVTGAAIVRAHVSVAGENETRFVDSDAVGQWKVDHIACGPVTVGAERVGFLPPRSGPVRAMLVVNAPFHAEKLELRPQAVLAGRVFDDQGDPILGAQVMLMASHVVGGLRGIQRSDFTITDDLGEYRFSGLAAGKYAVCARKDDGRRYAQRCQPGPVDGESSGTMDVAAGYEGRVDLSLSPLTAVRVSGVVSGAARSGEVTMVPRGGLSLRLSAPVRGDGTFLIGNVPPGSYVLSAGVASRVTLEVGGDDIAGIQLHAEPGFELAGTVSVASATGRKVDTTRYSVMLRSSGGNYPSEPISWNDGKATFTIADVAPDNYRLVVSSADPFYVKSATLGGRDMLASEVPVAPGAGNIEIVIADDGGAIDGDVSDPAWILLERDGEAWRNMRSDPAGHFKIDSVPPGDYQVYAWDDNTNVEYANPEWMKRNAKGVGVTVSPGQTAEVKIDRQIVPPE